ANPMITGGPSTGASSQVRRAMWWWPSTLPASQYTSTTRTDRTALRAELAEIRELGYSVGIGELEPQVHGISAAALDARDHPFAIVSIWGPRDRVPESRFPELGALAREAAADIAAMMP
ncbi:IclR family transcriptional regulator C-terminal domain-containing protein, partial [Saccharopolyspora sp. NPDC002686]|uniref:IclR family transcriptional regulator domain-containing protein n=1 Tax=Saccharopolyspora sp. NPDC002686 TaxID=3154541 RepID=UPI003320DE9D